MCGIVGLSGNRVEEVKNMLGALHHRGPDDNGIYSDEGITLGHVRLSILDLSSAGHQPMEYENLVIVFNGEVYNFREIRVELERRGYVFRSDSDTEVVLKAFHCFGEVAVERFIGMFAIALWDKSAHELRLYRDRVGVKPLYYYFKNGELIFASEVRSIAKCVDNLEICDAAKYEFFQFGYISSNLSIYNLVHKLPAGNFLIFRDGMIKVESYWSVHKFLEMPTFEASEEELIDRCEELLIDAFKLRMVADVPVGVFLSGGIDSSLVAAILQRYHGNIRTFTIGFENPHYNEATYAKAVANYLGVEHTEQIFTPDSVRGILSDFVRAYDEPFGDSSALPTLLVSYLAKENGIKVVLSADGGDEIFCGYERYKIAYNLSRKIMPLPRFFKACINTLMQRIGVKNIAKFVKVRNLEHKFNQLSEMLKAQNLEEFYELIIHNSKNYEILELLGKSFPPKTHAFALGERIHPMQGMMSLDYERYMVDDILVKVDRATMFHSIEGREPLLDHRIAEFAARLPFDMKYHNGKSKYILRKVLERYIPHEMIDRPKMGFGIPMFEWFSSDLRMLFDGHFNEEKLKSAGLNSSYVLREFERLKNGDPININKLWLILVFMMWLENRG